MTHDMTGDLPGEIRPDTDVDAVSALLAARLYEFNAAATGHTDGRRFAFTLRGEDGAVRAGVIGWTWGGCGYVDVLWVAEDLRGRGVGAALLARAEEVARSAGCGLMVLETHDFQAPRFYRAHGYQVVGTVEGYPRGHAQHHLAKRLGPG